MLTYFNIDGYSSNWPPSRDRDSEPLKRCSCVLEFMDDDINLSIFVLKTQRYTLINTTHLFWPNAFISL